MLPTSKTLPPEVRGYEIGTSAWWLKVLGWSKSPTRHVAQLFKDFSWGLDSATRLLSNPYALVPTAEWKTVCCFEASSILLLRRTGPDIELTRATLPMSHCTPPMCPDSAAICVAKCSIYLNTDTMLLSAVFTITWLRVPIYGSPYTTCSCQLV